MHEDSDVLRRTMCGSEEKINNAECTSLLGIGPGGEQGYYAWYLEVDHTWYRFFIQHGILFWDTAAPDSEDDLPEGEEYRAVFDEGWPKKHRSISNIVMAERILTIEFAGGRSLIVKENEDIGGMILEIK